MNDDKRGDLHRTEGWRRRFKTAELSDEEVQAISSSRMDDRHAHLDSMLDPKNECESEQITR